MNVISKDDSNWTVTSGEVFPDKITIKYIMQHLSLKKNKGGYFMSMLVVGFAAFGGVTFGYDAGSINGVLSMEPFLKTFGNFDPAKNAYVLSVANQSFIVSFLSLGTLSGALSCGFTADQIGRKGALILFSVIFIIGSILQSLSSTVPVIVVGRIVAGLSVGAISGLVPLYQSECAPKEVRGMVTSLYQVFITVGLVLSAIFAQAVKDSKTNAGWRLVLGIQAVWAFVLVAGILYLPESPRYFVRKSKNDKALSSLSKLRNFPPEHPLIREELEEVIDTVKQELDKGHTTWASCFKKDKQRTLRRTLCGTLTHAFQQLTGINFIFYFSTSFFGTIGIRNAFSVSLGLNFVNCFMSVLSLYFVERFGRRKLLVCGAVGMTICEFIIAIVGVSIKSSVSNIVLVVFTVLYISCFGVSWGPVAWVLIGELFPLQIRAKGVALSSASNWLLNFIIAFATPYLVGEGATSLHLGVKVFFIWGSTCACATIFAHLFVPELKGLKLEETEELWANFTTANETGSFVPTRRFNRAAYQEKEQNQDFTA